MNPAAPGAETVLSPRDAARPKCDPPAEQMGRARRLTILVLLSTVAFVALLDFFIVNVALAAISTDYRGSSLPAVSWVLSAYAIMFATVMVPAGACRPRAFCFSASRASERASSRGPWATRRAGPR